MGRLPEDKAQSTVRSNGDQPLDDLIDFPCSSLWLNHYADLGLTTRRSTSVSLQAAPVKQSRQAQRRPPPGGAPLDVVHLARLLLRLEGLIHELHRTLTPLRRGRKKLLRAAPKKSASKVPRLTGV